MAFLKYADAKVERTSIEAKAWNNVRQAAAPLLKVPINNFLPDFSIKDYLLSHCTIVASVDVEENGFHIKPASTKYVNDNFDAWERLLLAKTYPTFVGAQNYLEHVQIPALSKGRIIDAVARPVNNNESTYIDILVATEKKHRDLVAKIEDGRISTLSMGCSIKYSFCTKCGNKAEDEAQLCTCVRYLKGHYFHDDNGVERVIAELCGHKDDPDSNVFIEASWVENPAFKGAVLRNILDISGEQARQAAAKIEAVYTKPKEVPLETYLKAASIENLATIKKQVDSLLKNKIGFDVPGNGDRDPNVLPTAHADEIQKNNPHLPPIEQPQAPAQQSGSAAVPAQPAPAVPDAPAHAAAAPAPQQQQQDDPQLEQEMAAHLDGNQQPQQPPQQQQPAQQDADYQQDPDQPDPNDPMGGMAPQPQPTDSFDSLVTEVKKNIRQRVIDELQKEMDEQKINELNNIDNTKIDYGMDNNENLVTAFVDIYKPKTEFSKSKLASIFKMLVASESGKDFRKLAVSNRDMIDFFEFVDRFQISENALNRRDYALLRTATKSDLATFGSFVNFLSKNGITNKQVIKRICAKAKFLFR